MEAESRPSSAPLRSRADTMPADTLHAGAQTGRLQVVLDDNQSELVVYTLPNDCASSTACEMALTAPCISECMRAAPHLLLRCSGLPRAMTHSPTRSADDSPSLATGSRAAALMRSTARSDCLQGNEAASLWGLLWASRVNLLFACFLAN